MAHILIGGDLQNGPDVPSLLRRWGMTWGLWAPGAAGSLWPTTDECDVLILLLPAQGIPAPRTDGSAVSPQVPLLLLGEDPGSVLPARDAQRVLKDPGPCGVDLRSALRWCLEETDQLRGRQVEQARSQDQEGYLHFLGHELRSPLTAAKTAMEVLQGELGGLSSDGASHGPGGGRNSAQDSQLKMLDIALRNIKRLHQTVDWSQDLLELEAASTPGQWIEVPVAEMVAETHGLAGLEVQAEVREGCLESDPNLLNVLVGQMLRVLEYAQPDCPVKGVVRADPTRERGLELVLQAHSTRSSNNIPRIARTHLAEASHQPECDSTEELARLVSFVVSRPLVEQLQAEVTVLPEARGTPGLVLHLVLTANAETEAAMADEYPPVLHAPV